MLRKLLLKRQYNAAKKNGLLFYLMSGADHYSLPLEFVLAIASRETNIRHIIGDRGHGIGVIQIDTRYHAIAKSLKASGGWDSPEGTSKLVMYGCGMLRNNIAWAEKHWPQLTPLQHKKIAAAAYNAGMGGAKRGIAVGNADAYTTGKNYGKDVLSRMAIFAEILAEEAGKV